MKIFKKAGMTSRVYSLSPHFLDHLRTFPIRLEYFHHSSHARPYLFQLILFHSNLFQPDSSPLRLDFSLPLFFNQHRKPGSKRVQVAQDRTVRRD